MEDAGSLSGFEESALHAISIPTPEKPLAAGASIAGDGSERAFITYNGQSGYEVFDLNDLVVDSDGLLLERALGFFDVFFEFGAFGRARSITPLRGAGAPVAFVVTVIDPADVPETPIEPRLPSDLTLFGEPNPFGASTDIRFELPAASPVRLTVHDAIGREVATLTAGERTAGAHVVSWDGRGRGGRTLPQGVYFLRLQAGSLQTTSRIVRR